MIRKLSILGLVLCSLVGKGQVSPKLQAKVTQQAKEIEPKIIEWRRQFHEHPELSNHEFKTGARIAEFLKSLGYDDAKIAELKEKGII